MIPGSERFPWRRKWQPTPVFLPGKSHGQRGLVATGHGVAKSWTTPKSKLCQNPAPANDTCGFTHFPGAPFSNYMSYTGITSVLMGFFSVKVTWRPLRAGRVEVRELESIIKSHSCQKIEAYLSWHLFFMFLKNLQKY